jgi:hypothetical protein
VEQREGSRHPAERGHPSGRCTTPPNHLAAPRHPVDAYQSGGRVDLLEHRPSGVSGFPGRRLPSAQVARFRVAGCRRPLGKGRSVRGSAPRRSPGSLSRSILMRRPRPARAGYSRGRPGSARG